MRTFLSVYQHIVPTNHASSVGMNAEDKIYEDNDYEVKSDYWHFSSHDTYNFKAMTVYCSGSSLLCMTLSTHSREQ